MSAIFAAASESDFNVLFLILALIAFAGAIYAAVVLHNYVGAGVAAFIGILILLFAA